jgi:hypothetical protein
MTVATLGRVATKPRSSSSVHEDPGEAVAFEQRSEAVEEEAPFLVVARHDDTHRR